MSRGNLFDDISRVVASPVSRRRALTRILGALAGVATVPLWPSRAQADVACPQPFQAMRCATVRQCCMINGRPGCCSGSMICYGGRCCPPTWVCGINGCCMAPHEVCVSGMCCPRLMVCGTTCCRPTTGVCINGSCCPTVRACGTVCCAAGKRCDRTTMRCV